ncbi:Ribosomal protein S18 acetylase RimI [Halomicrobium zhouii]|uniref:Ribosomal protein S18 acetylase RimI n=1 Tax=Halomicrobium zhouii TaxID=767519 RepID=A0A1I6LI22_9EURY|nr:GNAT family N-acetyltransferase [Halomicrobium zhouii]SFS03074.1 Ribosomal protein S18 acetylase RimI [Halomicrobium zhouii]
MSRQEPVQREYAVRKFESSDLPAFLDLHSEAFDPNYGPEWFAWKYEDNPYVDHVPIFVAERDGDLVGARPFFALDVAVGGERALALQPGDTMVHPDHRRQGLFTRMTEAAIETYSDGKPAFFFNFPNHRSGPGYLKLGWQSVGEETTYYRIQNTNAFGLDESPAWKSVTGAAGLALGGYNRLSDLRTRSPDGVTVRRYESVPVETMADLAASESSSGIHVWRDERFYDWRFDTPAWDYATYVAERDGEPVAGMVVGTAVESGLRTTKVTDVVPTPDGEATDAQDALLHRLVRDYAESDVLAAPSALSRSALGRAGFRSDDRPPLGSVANPTTHVVRSLTGDWTHNGVDITDASNWRLTFSEQDTS